VPTDSPIYWQDDPTEITTPDDGDTFHLVDRFDGRQVNRAMSRVTAAQTLVRFVNAYVGEEAGEELAQLSERLARARK